MTPPILYLHGFASSPKSKKASFFAQKFVLLGHKIDVLELDQGHFNRLTVTSQLGVIERAARGRPVILMGSSMGGYLAALYAARHPEVAKLVLMAPAFCFPRRWPASLGPEKMREWQITGALTLYHYGLKSEQRIGFGLIEDAAQYEDFPEFRQPGLIFHGRNDLVVPASYSEQFAARHANVTLRLMDSDHELTDVLEPMWEEVWTFLGLSRLSMIEGPA